LQQLPLSAPRDVKQAIATNRHTGAKFTTPDNAECIATGAADIDDTIEHIAVRAAGGKVAQLSQR
jgi:hypothetical protein